MTPVLDSTTWLLARSAGIAAYFVLSIGLLLGLALALGLVPPRAAARAEAARLRIAVAALTLLGLHGLVLLFDDRLEPGVGGVLVPFVLNLEPVWTGLGILAGYVLIVAVVGTCVRGRVEGWAQRVSPVAWLLATVHVLGAGSDTGRLWLQVPLALTIAATIALLGYRIALRPEPPRPEGPTPPPRSGYVVPETLWAGRYDRR